MKSAPAQTVVGWTALARELLWNPNWPAHAARELGDPGYLDLLPLGYAW